MATRTDYPHVCSPDTARRLVGHREPPAHWPDWVKIGWIRTTAGGPFTEEINRRQRATACFALVLEGRDG